MLLHEVPIQVDNAGSYTSSARPFPIAVQPMDEYNRKLVENVHPPAWQNPAPQERYNLVVVGAGTAGLVGAIGASGLGGKVALIERHLIGGDCLNWGCVPSKSIVRSAKAIGELRKAAELGIIVPDGVEVNFGAIMARMRAIRAEISQDDSVERIRREGVQIFLGEARFAGPF
jgi:pyruvate/2-oxoglutarate dehydrogenase complex dihydrolipoamide dehydrogenase (E3) component